MTVKQVGEWESSVSLVDYVTASIPLIKVCLKKDVGGLISRIFYGVEYPFCDWIFPLLYSEGAINVAKGKKLPLDEMVWWADSRYVRSGNNKVLHREHIFTGKMFKNSLRTLSDKSQLTPNNVVDLIKNNYCIAWIDMMEDHAKVNERKGKDGVGKAKSDRGINLKEALLFFKEKGVVLRDTFPKLS